MTVTDTDRAALQALRREPTLSPLERDRVEMVLLAAAGWSAPRSATHLGRCEPTMRTTLRRYAAGGPAGRRQRRTGPPPNLARYEQFTAALSRLLGEDRTWTADQLALSLAELGLPVSSLQTRRYLHAMGARWRRVARTLRHKQDPVRVAHAAAVLEAVKKRPVLVE